MDKDRLQTTPVRSDDQRKKLNCYSRLALGVFVIAGMLLSGCRGNPSVRKQRYLESGDRFNSEGKFKEASIQYLNALRFDEDFAEAHYGLAQAYERLGQFSAAREELERTVDSQPTNSQARIELGNLLCASNRPEEARAQATAVLQAEPDNPDAHALLSAIAAGLGQGSQALLEIQRALKLDPRRAAFHDNLALLQAGDPDKTSSVEAELKQAVALAPGSLNVRLLLAAFYLKNNRLVEAERAGWDAVSSNPTSLTARANVAQVIFKEGDWARAEQVLRQASRDLADNPQAAQLLGNYYIETEQFTKARSEFASLVVKYPRSNAILKGYTRVLIQSGDYAAARPLLLGLLKSNPKDPEITALNGILLLNDGNTRESFNALQDGARILPKDALIQYWAGKASQATGNAGLAERYFRQSANLNPAERKAQEEMAQIASQRGDIALLSTVAEKTIAALPRFPNGYVWRAVVAMDRNSLDQAEADLNHAITIAPQNWQAYLELGKLRFAQKRFPEGCSLLKQALDYNPNSVEAMRLLVEYDLFQHHPDQALTRVKAQIEKSRTNSAYYDLLAKLQVQNQQYDDASATARKAIQLNSADGEAVRLFAQIAVQRGQTANALAAWEKWSSEHPLDAGALAVLGTLEESSGDSVKAEAYYKKSLQIQPQQPIAANNLAYQMLLKGEAVDVALSLAETARQGMPDSPNTADTLAWAYYYKGTYQFARDLLEDALNASPNNAAMHYHLGMVYSKLRDKRDAAIHLKKALMLAHDSQTEANARVALQGLG